MGNWPVAKYAYMKNNLFGFQGDFVKQLIHARFVQEQNEASGHITYRWQVSVSFHI